MKQTFTTRQNCLPDEKKYFISIFSLLTISLSLLSCILPLSHQQVNSLSPGILPFLVAPVPSRVLGMEQVINKHFSH